jgi:hypothetical protein
MSRSFSSFHTWAYLLSLSNIIRHAEPLPSGIIPPQLAVYPVPGFSSALDCKPNEYIPVFRMLLIMFFEFHAQTLDFCYVFRVYVDHLHLGIKCTMVLFNSLQIGRISLM